MTPDEDQLGSAAAAKEAAQQHLADATAQDKRVRGIVDSLRDLRRRNHFGESIERAMRRRSA